MMRSVGSIDVDSVVIGLAASMWPDLNATNRMHLSAWVSENTNMICPMQDYMAAIQARADLTAKRNAANGDEAKAAYDAAIKAASDYIVALEAEVPNNG